MQTAIHNLANKSEIQSIKQRLQERGYTTVDEDQINYALVSKNAEGNVDKAVDMLVLYQQSLDGVIKSYKPEVHMLGAVNREAVTCYIDALLFAMFARLESFEPILRKTFDDEPRRRLAVLIRMWVNMIRTGELVHTDIVSFLVCFNVVVTN